MTCRQALPVLGSMAAHDSLVETFVQWRLKQQSCEAMPDDAVQAAMADEAWATMKRHAVNCGWTMEAHGPLSAWAPRRIRSYGKSIGVSEQMISVAVEPDVLSSLQGGM